MGDVVKLPHFVAWAPMLPTEVGYSRVNALILSAILVPPGTVMDSDTYLSYLGDRIQRTVNACEDPQFVTDALVEDLWNAGLYPEPRGVKAQEAGNCLVWSNPGTWQRLRSWGVLPMQPPYELGPTVEQQDAREIINGERDDPEDHVRHWAGVLGRLP